MASDNVGTGTSMKEYKMKRGPKAISESLMYGLALVGASVMSCLSLNASADTTAQAKKPIEVRWLLAHEPVDAFRRAANIFAEQLDKSSGGELKLVLVTPSEFGSNTGNISTKKVISLLAANKVQLSQTITSGLGEIDPQFYVLDLPYLFRSHEHAAHVLEGPIGTRMLASLEKTNIRGLAFTYSGGYRVVPSSGKAIRTAEDFKGLKMRTTTSPVAQETMRELGATPEPMKIDATKEAMEASKIDAAETTYIRIDSVAGLNTKFINETEHSLFLTSILANKDFLNSLSEKNREALKKAAVIAARLEREDSINDGLKMRDEYAKKGVQIISMTPEAKADLEKKLHPIYKKFENLYGHDLVESIIAAK